MSKSVEIPKLECEGCTGRDRLIRLLSKRIDKLELERDGDILELPRQQPPPKRIDELDPISGTFHGRCVRFDFELAES